MSRSKILLCVVGFMGIWINASAEEITPSDLQAYEPCSAPEKQPGSKDELVKGTVVFVEFGSAHDGEDILILDVKGERIWVGFTERVWTLCCKGSRIGLGDNTRQDLKVGDKVEVFGESTMRPVDMQTLLMFPQLKDSTPTMLIEMNVCSDLRYYLKKLD